MEKNLLHGTREGEQHKFKIKYHLQHKNTERRERNIGPNEK